MKLQKESLKAFLSNFVCDLIWMCGVSVWYVPYSRGLKVGMYFILSIAGFWATATAIVTTVIVIKEINPVGLHISSTVGNSIGIVWLIGSTLIMQKIPKVNGPLYQKFGRALLVTSTFVAGVLGVIYGLQYLTL